MRVVVIPLSGMPWPQSARANSGAQGEHGKQPAPEGRILQSHDALIFDGVAGLYKGVHGNVLSLVRRGIRLTSYQG